MGQEPVAGGELLGALGTILPLAHDALLSVRFAASETIRVEAERQAYSERAKTEVRLQLTAYST